MAEQRLGVIKCTMSAGYWDLHVTSARIVAAMVASGGWGAMFGALGAAVAQYFANKRSDELARVSVQSVRTAHKQNFDMPLGDIAQVTVKRPGTFLPGSFVFELRSGKKRTLALRNKKAFDESTALLERVLSERVTLK